MLKGLFALVRVTSSHFLTAAGFINSPPPRVQNGRLPNKLQYHLTPATIKNKVSQEVLKTSSFCTVPPSVLWGPVPLEVHRPPLAGSPPAAPTCPAARRQLSPGRPAAARHGLQQQPQGQRLCHALARRRTGCKRRKAKKGCRAEVSTQHLISSCGAAAALLISRRQLFSTQKLWVQLSTSMVTCARLRHAPQLHIHAVHISTKLLFNAAGKEKREWLLLRSLPSQLTARPSTCVSRPCRCPMWSRQLR